VSNFNFLGFRRATHQASSGFSLDQINGTLSGTFSPDASYIGGIEIAGFVDAREVMLVDLGIEAETADEICYLWLGFGIQCQPCASDGLLYCVEWHLEDLVANETGQSLGLVCEEDCHIECSNSICSSPQSLDLSECPQ